jgi:hypothetical protein
MSYCANANDTPSNDGANVKSTVLHQGEVKDDPLVWATVKRVSRGIAALSLVLLLLARWLPAIAILNGQ